MFAIRHKTGNITVSQSLLIDINIELFQKFKPLILLNSLHQGSTLNKRNPRKRYKVSTMASKGVLFVVINLYRVSMGKPTNQRIINVPVM